MATIPSQPGALPPDAIGAFADILADAYGSGNAQDYVEFDSVVFQTFQWRLGRKCGPSSTPSEALVDCVIQKAQQKSPEFFRYLIVAFFRALSWNAPLRGWMTQYQASDLPTVPEADYEAARLRRERIGNVAEALDKIGEARDETPVGQAIDDAHDDLKEVTGRLRLLSGCKNIHDLLHEIQIGAYQGVAALILCQEPFSADQVAQVAACARSLADSADRIESNLQLIDVPPGSDLPPPPDKAWLDDLREAIAPLGATPPVVASVRSGVYNLRIVLRNQLPAYDAAIVNAADGIPFAGLIAFLRSAASLAAVPNDVVTAATDLAALEDQLTRLLALHRAWQQIDTDLWQVDQEIWPRPDTADASVVAFLWKQLSRRLAAVQALGPDCWDANLTSAMERVKLALAAGVIDTAAASVLGEFVRIMRLQFAKIDKLLLSQCNQILRLLSPIQTLLQEKGA